MEPMLAANPPDTNKILAQIDHTAQARAELEKAMPRCFSASATCSRLTSGPNSGGGARQPPFPHAGWTRWAWWPRWSGPGGPGGPEGDVVYS